MNPRKLTKIFAITSILLVLATSMTYVYFRDLNWVCAGAMIIFGVFIGFIQIIIYFFNSRVTRPGIQYLLASISGVLLAFFALGLYYFMTQCSPWCLDVGPCTT